jgi:thiamine biosynthesis lipoprotein
MASSDSYSSTSPSCAEVSRMRPAMGTLVHVSASGRESAVQQSVDAALDTVEKIDRLMSFHDPESDLSRVNRDAARTPQAVHPWTWAVLRRALCVSEASAGLFDITVAPLLVREGLLPESTDVLYRSGNWRHIALTPDGSVYLEQPMLLDLGGIAKGFAVDMAIHELRKGGCTQGVVNAGGDLRRFGPDLHPVHLRHRDGLVQVAELRCGAVATSVPHAIHEERLAQPLGSIFDPRTHLAWRTRGAVMVAASTCVIADALTKVAALAGPTCEPLLARFGARALWDIAT